MNSPDITAPLREGYRQTAVVGDLTVLLKTREFEDGKLGEISVVIKGANASLASLVNAMAVSISVGLQHGVPLEKYVDRFIFSRFEPSGPVSGNENVRFASSILDYLARELSIHYLERRALSHASVS